MGDDGRPACPGAGGIALLLVVLLLVFLLLSFVHPVAAVALVMGGIGLVALSILGRAWRGVKHP